APSQGSKYRVEAAPLADRVTQGVRDYAQRLIGEAGTRRGVARARLQGLIGKVRFGRRLVRLHPDDAEEAILDVFTRAELQLRFVEQRLVERERLVEGIAGSAER